MLYLSSPAAFFLQSGAASYYHYSGGSAVAHGSSVYYVGTTPLVGAVITKHTPEILNGTIVAYVRQPNGTIRQVEYYECYVNGVAFDNSVWYNSTGFGYEYQNMTGGQFGASYGYGYGYGYAGTNVTPVSMLCLFPVMNANGSTHGDAPTAATSADVGTWQITAIYINGYLVDDVGSNLPINFTIRSRGGGNGPGSGSSTGSTGAAAGGTGTIELDHEELDLTVNNTNCTFHLYRSVQQTVNRSTMTVRLYNLPNNSEVCDNVPDFMFYDQIPASFAASVADVEFSLPPFVMNETDNRVGWVFAGLSRGESYTWQYFTNRTVYGEALKDFLGLASLALYQPTGPATPAQQLPQAEISAPTDVQLGGDITGYVLINGTRPASAYTLEVINPAGRRLAVITDSTGGFSFTPDSEGTYSFVGVQDCQLLSVATTNVRAAAVPFYTVSFSAKPEKGVPVTITVLDNYVPAPGVTVKLISPSGQVFELVTDANGQVVFTPAEEGDYQIEVAGQLLGAKLSSSPAASATPTAGTQKKGIDLTLPLIAIGLLALIIIGAVGILLFGWFRGRRRRGL